MKFRATFKTPEAVDAMREAILAAAAEQVAVTSAIEPVGDETASEAVEALAGTAEAFVRLFVEYGECITIEFDLTARTATVVPARYPSAR